MSTYSKELERSYDISLTFTSKNRKLLKINSCSHQKNLLTTGPLNARKSYKEVLRGKKNLIIEITLVWENLPSIPPRTYKQELLRGGRVVGAKKVRDYDLSLRLVKGQFCCLFFSNPGFLPAESKFQSSELESSQCLFRGLNMKVVSVEISVSYLIQEIVLIQGVLEFFSYNPSLF